MAALDKSPSPNPWDPTTWAGPTQLHRTDYYLWALGFFVTNFAVIEGILQKAVWHLAGLKPPMAQAVLSGLRTETATSYIRRIADAYKWSAGRKREVEYILGHLLLINRLRNDLLHYGATKIEGSENWLITNEPFVHVPEKIRHTHISPKMLTDAGEDLYKISVHLGMLIWSDEEIADGDMERYREVLQNAWRYKSHGQNPQDRRTPTKARTRSRRHSPSRA
jgi:hypothetical protein